MRRLLPFAFALAFLAGACGSSHSFEGRLFVANTTSKSVTVYDGRTWKLLSTVRLPGRPHGIQAQPDAPYVWTANVEGNSVSVIDQFSMRLVRTIPVCVTPDQIAFEDRYHKAFVACGDGYMSVIDTVTFRQIDRPAIGFGPHAIVAGPDGHVWSANRGSNDLSEIDPATNKLLARHPAGPFAYGLAFSPSGKYAYVTSKKWNSVVVVSVDDGQILGAIRVGLDPSLLAASRDGKRVYVANRGDGTVSVINALTFQVIRTIRVEREPDGVGLSPDGRLLFVSNYSSASVSVIDTGSTKVVRRLVSGSGPSDVVAVGSER